MTRNFRIASWALIGVVILALWAWSSHVATRSSPNARPTATSAERAQRPDISADADASRASVDAAVARAPQAQATTRAPASAAPTWLPLEARQTLQLIARGGPFPHRQDGGTFGNRERRLPPQPRGWYREYTVDTPGSGDRGARRIIAGGDPPIELYYTGDHYRSFRRIPGAGGAQ